MARLKKNEYWMIRDNWRDWVSAPYKKKDKCLRDYLNACCGSGNPSMKWFRNSGYKVERVLITKVG